jgi:hypothetical protein
MQAWAQAVVDRTLALTERLQLNEVDAPRGEALLRTMPVHKAGERLYYEVHLQGAGRLSVRRFRVANEVGAVRDQAAFTMTHETLARLAGELTGA